MLNIKLTPCKKNAVLPMALTKLEVESHTSDRNIQLPIGSFLYHNEEKFFKVVGTNNFPTNQHIYTLPLLKAMKDVDNSEELSFEIKKSGYSLAVVTLSDKGYQCQREDVSGELIKNIMQDVLPLNVIDNFLLPDDPLRLKALVSHLALENQYDIIITTGGTGIAPTDLTPESLLPLLTRRFHGFEQAMMAASFQKTPNALISRAFAGTIEKTFVLALQGSPKAVRENLETIMPALPHTLEKLKGSMRDCATL